MQMAVMAAQAEMTAARPQAQLKVRQVRKGDCTAAAAAAGLTIHRLTRSMQAQQARMGP
jgi:hypothetical protein